MTNIRTMAAVLLFLCVFPTQARVPQKFRDPGLRFPVASESRFPRSLLTNGNFVTAKAQEWSACHRLRRAAPFAATVDPLPAFLEGPVQLTKLDEMEARHLQQGQVARQPWSGDYWPYARGLLASRYADNDFGMLMDWISRYTFVRKHPTQSLLREGPAGLAKLSPAEKYDLLMGDPRFQLTASMWAQGKEYYDEKGDVESWMGLCHGWAPAAFMEPRPQNTITVPSPSGAQTVSLNPSDLKGLITYSWATNEYESVFLGARCNERNPKRDENGRIIDPDCFDLNPATWHLAVINSVGLARRSFVMDATYDYEVWNQPVLGYKYTYFNPRSRQPVSRVRDAVVSRADFEAVDPFRKYRASSTKFLAGVEMTIGYIVETQANAQSFDRSEQDAIRWVSYRYDLELDANGAIIGGEWYDEAHPDFIWTPLKNSTPSSAGDAAILRARWNGNGPLPAAWTDGARQQSRFGVLPHPIARALLQKAAQ